MKHLVLGSLLEGARAASGAVAIIDVFRAFTTAAVAIANGATRIIMVASVAEALALRQAGLVQMCMGESHGHMPDGFDLSNSPYTAAQADLRGMAIAQRTSAGTQGIVAAASKAGALYAAALVTARATARACAASGQDRITIVAMGKDGLTRTDEDEVCALHMRNILEGRPGNPAAVRRIILAAGEAPRFRTPHPPHSFPQDLDIALDVDLYDFALRVTMENGHPVARRESVP